ncbi:hypothetical protein [Kibdelosporangium phytohabitans]|uniref:PE domain-containing protein n=1 Tax=Kibdelosporangium phytohabitans TaxID=860235 RepID=A0A0N9ICP8_9PSEU|nr:hypothetical protein [Kibdelosporangium phytohabitans]ALG14212.1 hypothetical protein AOZ06_51650 [Kibdelosporangium phytohabitans]MBE1466789.1 uncharacterized protein YukE [Kibdelosporangium phytohabitans]
MKVNPPAIPGARDAFHEAAQKIDDLVQVLRSMTTPAWAQDPVSKITAARFETGNGDTGRIAAIQALTKYGQELRNSGDALNEAYDRYMRVEGSNTDRWRGKGFQDV